MYLKRELEDKIKQYLKSPEIIAVFGSRQVGKTTLLKKIYLFCGREDPFRKGGDESPQVS